MESPGNFSKEETSNFDPLKEDCLLKFCLGLPPLFYRSGANLLDRGLERILGTLTNEGAKMSISSAFFRLPSGPPKLAIEPAVCPLVPFEVTDVTAELHQRFE